MWKFWCMKKCLSEIKEQDVSKQHDNLHLEVPWLLTNNMHSKLTERVICDQLVDYLTSHDIICPEQHGFRRGHPTESAMLDAVQFIISEADRGRVVSNIAADASSTADSWKSWANGAQSALWAEMHCQLTKIRVLNYMRLEPVSESTNERQELVSLIG